MKILVIGLDGAVPELLFGDERLTNFRLLMEGGGYGRLASPMPSSAVPAWMCLAASQDPGSLGVYGLRNRTGYAYSDAGMVSSHSIEAPALWDQVTQEGKHAILVGVPPSYPLRQLRGICVGCYLTPDTRHASYVYPATLQQEITDLVGQYPIDVQGLRTHHKDRLKEAIYTMSRKQFAVVRHLLQRHEWDYFQFVEIGLDRIQRGFWQFHDPQHRNYKPGNPYEQLIRDYYRHLDAELGTILELLDDETVILVASTHGAQPLVGGFCINEWLVREGLLVLDEYPSSITPLSQFNVNWDRTKVWCEGGDVAQVFLNVQGREPRGTLAPADYETFRDELKTRLEGLVDAQGQPLGAQVWKPEELYSTVRRVAPDLLVHFGTMSWRALASVGYPRLYVQSDDVGLDDCNPTPYGSLILAAPNNPLQGAIEGAHVLHVAPTLLELGGYDVPASMQGQALLKSAWHNADVGLSADDEALIRERLSGLGYIA